MCWSFSANAQQPTPPTGGETPAEERVTRLQDSLATGEDWDIGVPVVAAGPSSNSASSFADSVRDGRALDSEAYLSLYRELRQLQQRLRGRPSDDAAQRQLADLRQAVIERIEINLRFGYLYAATVYVELLRQADGPTETVRRLSQRLVESRSAEQP